MLKFRNPRTQRLRLAMGGLMFAALAGAPLVLGLTRPAPEAKATIETDVPGMVGVYTHGLSSLGVAGLVALPLAMIFAVWLMAGQARDVKRR